ncbi:hypothetical protein K8R66_02845 [bacterium]|nr:hypothetical protein [bacterium]
MKLIKLTTILLSIASGLTTWQGFLKMLQYNPYGKAFSVIWALVSAFSITIMWLTLYKWFPEVDEKTQKKMLWTFPLVLTFIFLVSSYLSIIGLGGDIVELAHMENSIKEADEILLNLGGEVENDLSFANSVSLFEKQFESLRIFETKGGVSGIPGTDIVVYQLESLVITLGNLNENLQKSIKERRRAINEARTEISSLREVINDFELSINEKKIDFSMKLSTINQLFKRIKGAEVNNTVQGVVKSMEDFSPSRKIGMKNKNIVDAQKNATEKILSSVNEAKKIMNKTLETRKRRYKEFEILRPMNISLAVWKYANHIPAAWAGGIGFDYFPLIFFLWIIWTAESRKENETKKELLDIEKYPNE